MSSGESRIWGPTASSSELWAWWSVVGFPAPRILKWTEGVKGVSIDFGNGRLVLPEFAAMDVVRRGRPWPRKAEPKLVPLWERGSLLGWEVGVVAAVRFNRLYIYGLAYR